MTLYPQLDSNRIPPLGWITILGLRRAIKARSLVKPRAMKCFASPSLPPFECSSLLSLTTILTGAMFNGNPY